MSIQPTQLTFDCVNCGWRRTTAPADNMLSADDFFTCCSECGNRDLIVRPASPWAAWLARRRKRQALKRLRRSAPHPTE